MIGHINKSKETGYIMKSIESILQKEMDELKEIAEKARKRLQTAPKGHLRIMKKRKGVEYYYKSEKETGSSNGRYMKKSEMRLVKGIAQRDYDTRLLGNAEERIKAIDTFLKKYEKTSLAGVYRKTNIYRKELICPSIIPDDEYAKLWQSVEYKGKPFFDEKSEIITERGERVRSKSEKIIADKLHLLGIPYRYEYPLVLEGHIEIRPDFTILKITTREEVYLEHCGLMDNADYVDSVMYKLRTYERNGIFLGVNLFITYETSKNPLNARMLNELFKKAFCVE